MISRAARFRNATRSGTLTDGLCQYPGCTRQSLCDSSRLFPQNGIAGGKGFGECQVSSVVAWSGERGEGVSDARPVFSTIPNRFTTRFLQADQYITRLQRVEHNATYCRVLTNFMRMSTGNVFVNVMESDAVFWWAAIFRTPSSLPSSSPFSPLSPNLK